jgi:hypothetical protein
MHQLLAHDPLFNPAFLMNKSIDGLHDDIKSVVLLQRPKDLDTASSLAILQEELLLGQPTHDFKKLDNSSHHSKGYQKFEQSTSSPSHRPSITESTPSSVNKNVHSSGKEDEKLSSLTAYKKALGLCFKCGAKWGPQHKCAAIVPLHLVEEVWHMTTDQDSNLESSSESNDDELMALSEHALKGISAPHTLKLAASIHNYKSIILVDSRSSHNFISEHLASQLTPWTPLPHSMTVRVADGAVVRCSHEIVNCSWSVQGTLFTTTFKILPLDCYDAILAMEWLESFSPMQVY